MDGRCICYIRDAVWTLLIVPPRFTILRKNRSLQACPTIGSFQAALTRAQTATSRQNAKQERAASEQDEKFQIFCAILLQAQWRGRQMRLRHGLMRRPAPKVVRAFSWSKSSRRSGAASTPPVKPPAHRQANGEASLGRHPDGSSTKPVKRSSSFDRLASALRGNRTSRASTARGSPGSVTFGSADAVSAQPQARPELLYITLMKGRNRDLGLELDSKNTVSFIVRAAPSLGDHQAGRCAFSGASGWVQMSHHFVSHHAEHAETLTHRIAHNFRRFRGARRTWMANSSLATQSCRSMVCS